MKKAQMLMSSYFVKLVLIVVFLLFGIVLVMKVFGWGIFAKSFDIVCWQSVLFNHEKRIPGINAEMVKTNCPSKYITFHTTEFEEEFQEVDPDIINFNPFKDRGEKQSVEYSKEGVPCKNIDDEDEKEACVFWNINFKIAKEMQRCWHNFHEGRLRVFSVYDTSKQCVVCSTFFFDNEMISEYSDLGSLGLYSTEADYNLDVFMRTYKINMNTDASPTYYEYTLDLLDKNWETDIYDYSVSSDYSIVFRALNEHWLTDYLGDIWNDIKEKLTGKEYDDDPNFMNTIHFIPNEAITEYCETWA